MKPVAAYSASPYVIIGSKIFAIRDGAISQIVIGDNYIIGGSNPADGSAVGGGIDCSDGCEPRYGRDEGGITINVIFIDFSLAAPG